MWRGATVVSAVLVAAYAWCPPRTFSMFTTFEHELCGQTKVACVLGLVLTLLTRPLGTLHQAARSALGALLVAALFVAYFRMRFAIEWQQRQPWNTGAVDGFVAYLQLVTATLLAAAAASLPRTLNAERRRGHHPAR